MPVLVDGVDVREWNKQELRRHLGLVLQDVFLFSGDIANNITLGDRRIGEAQMLEAARRAQIAPFIETLPANTTRKFRSAARHCRRDSGNSCLSRGRWLSIRRS